MIDIENAVKPGSIFKLRYGSLNLHIFDEQFEKKLGNVCDSEFMILDVNSPTNSWGGRLPIQVVLINTDFPMIGWVFPHPSFVKENFEKVL